MDDRSLGRGSFLCQSFIKLKSDVPANQSPKLRTPIQAPEFTKLLELQELTAFVAILLRRRGRFDEISRECDGRRALRSFRIAMEHLSRSRRSSPAHWIGRSPEMA
ncbi:hypothetical protein A6X21_07045 [Planctopirus hydrillae]|uniref:Uncharacterized protein n=1 Tax=Planctopirus hydrillae TaxID=1841610 RepID=A0A1C3EA39_9PLAN|nr:hypothetical protein A6X21_07045 [Planctopirus hydrillae]